MLFYTKATAFTATATLLLASGGVGIGLSANAAPHPATVQHPQSLAGASQDAGDIAGYEVSFPALGTIVNLKTFHSDRSLVEQAVEAAEAEVKRLEGILSDYDSESETRQLTVKAVQQKVVVSDDLWRVLEASDRWYRLSDGAFDASLGSLTRQWRQSRRGGKLPDSAAIEHALERSGWQHIQISADDQTVVFDREDIQLDFGAIGKGYIVDRVFELLADRGLECSLVNISGNMRCGTPPPEREGWRIAVAPLEKGGQPLREIVVRDCSIATSGDLWQYAMIDGVRRSHVLDPRTGWGVPGPRSATVIAPLATDADALATIACVLEPEQALALAASLAEAPQLLLAKRVEESAQVVESSGFPSAANK